MKDRVYVEYNGIRERVQDEDIIDLGEGRQRIVVNNQDHPIAFWGSIFGLPLKIIHEPLALQEEENQS